MPTRNVSDVLPPEELAQQQALVQIKPRIAAMPESAIERRNTLDASAAAVIALATSAKVEAFRAPLEARFGSEAGVLLDEIPIVALATRQADVELAAVAAGSDLSAEYEELHTLYQMTLADAESLGYRGFIDIKRLDAARNTRGYEATIDSVEVMVAVLREDWAKIEGHTPITKAQLDLAVALAKRLSKALGERENGVHRAPAIETRIRVLSLLVSMYDELRRMMTYLRWHQDDVDQLAPSLWASRGRRTRTQNGVDPGVDNPAIDDDGEPATPVTPSPINGGGPFTS